MFIIFSPMKTISHRSLYLFACAFVISLSVCGQTPAYKNYTTLDGLPSDIVYSIMQDDDGFIWISTDKGVCRFDGTHFKTFTMADGLTGSTILKTIQDKDGRIWFLAFNGKLCFYRDGKIHNPDNDTLLKKITFTASPYIFYQNTTRNIWLSSPNSSTLYRLSSDTIQTYHVPSPVFSIWEDKQGKIKMIVGGGALTITDTGYIFTKMDAYKTIGSIYHIPGDTVMWVITGEGIITSDLDGNVLRFGRPSNYSLANVQGFQADNSGNVWLSTLNGVVQFDSGTISPAHEHIFLTNHIFSSAFKDRDNNFWFGSEGSGVYRIPSLGSRVYDYASGLMDNNVASVSPMRDGRLLAGMRNGSVQLIDDEVVKPQHQSLVPPGSGTLVKTLRDSGGNVWVLYNRGLYKYDGKKFIFCKDPHSWYKTIYQANDGVIWIGRGNGIGKISGNHMENVLLTEANRIYAIIEGTDDNLLLGTERGLYLLKNNTYEAFDSSNLLLSHQINSLAFTPDSSVWIATEDEGLLRLKHDTITVYTRRDGLSSLRCIELQADGNELYVLTDKGINKLEIKQNNIAWTLYTISNLFGNCEINQFVKQNLHTLLLATNRGVLKVDERELSRTSISQPYINSFSVNDMVKQVVQTNELPYNNNNIQIEFGAIDFSSAAILYRYRLEGLENSWNYTSSNIVKYAGLPPGDYRFVVTVRQADGRWLQQKTPLSFHIRAPWWATWWCLLASVVVVLLIIAIIVRWRLSAYRHKLDQQRAFAESELKALRAQINPHFIYNALNSIQDFVLTNQKEDANLYLTKFARLMRSILSNSRKARITLAEEISSLSLYLELETLRFNNSFCFRFETDERIVPENVEIPSMILQPYVENAILHGLATIEHGGVIRISFTPVDGFLVCTIEDNGIGRKKSAEMREGRRWASTPSLGMRITEERMELISEYQKERITLEIDDLEDDGQQASGTRVTIYFPMEYNQ